MSGHTTSDSRIPTHQAAVSAQNCIAPTRSFAYSGERSATVLSESPMPLPEIAALRRTSREQRACPPPCGYAARVALDP